MSFEEPAITPKSFMDNIFKLGQMIAEDCVSGTKSIHHKRKEKGKEKREKKKREEKKVGRVIESTLE